MSRTAAFHTHGSPNPASIGLCYPTDNHRVRIVFQQAIGLKKQSQPSKRAKTSGYHSLCISLFVHRPQIGHRQLRYVLVLRSEASLYREKHLLASFSAALDQFDEYNTAKPRSRGLWVLLTPLFPIDECEQASRSQFSLTISGNLLALI